MKVSQSRINGCENYRNQISDPVKTLRVQKDVQLKKVNRRTVFPEREIVCSSALRRSQCCEQLARAQADLQVTIRDLTKTRKTYQEAEQTSQAVREKADMEAKYVLADLRARGSDITCSKNRAKCYDVFFFSISCWLVQHKV